MTSTFCSSFEENLAAAAGESAVVAARRLVRTDQTRPLRWEEELHGEQVLSAGLKPAAKHMNMFIAGCVIKHVVSTPFHLFVVLVLHSYGFSALLVVFYATLMTSTIAFY